MKPETILLLHLAAVQCLLLKQLWLKIVPMCFAVIGFLNNLYYQKMLRYGLLAIEGIWESRNAGFGASFLPDSFYVPAGRLFMTLKLTSFY